MAMSKNTKTLGSAPTQESQLYPDTDGKPMAASDEHRFALIRLLGRLEQRFREKPEVYVSGDILMYYVQGDPRKVISPDVLVTFGIGQKRRQTYLVWSEGKPPDFVMEFSSKTTYQRDLREKLRLYASLGIPEYFLCDIEGLYLPVPLMGFTLVAGTYEPLLPGSEGEVYSSVLGLDFHLRFSEVHLYHRETRQWIPTPEEAAEAHAKLETLARQQEAARANQEAARADQEAARADQEAARADQEAARAAASEAETAALRAELNRLRGNQH